jgi:CheY-like chemotaxis protein
MKTILYVEDDEHDIFFLKRAFGSQAPDLRIHNVLNAADAMAYLSADGPYADRARFPAADLVVSDVSIPGGSGFQLLAWIRQEPRFAGLPVILLTGSAQQKEIDYAVTAGANFCLEKSTNFDELLAKVRASLLCEHQ